MMTTNIIGYHTNSIQKSNRFIGGRKLELSTDTQFLGKGMYFWDNLANARWWAREKIRKEDLEEVHVSTATILLENVLDLTDEEEIRLVQTFWTTFCRRKGYKKEKSHHFIGCILDVLFDCFPEFHKNYYVVKCHGDYSKAKKIYWLVELGDDARIDSRPKTIYSVKNESALTNRSHLEKITKG